MLQKNYFIFPNNTNRLIWKTGILNIVIFSESYMVFKKILILLESQKGSTWQLENTGLFKSSLLTYTKTNLDNLRCIDNWNKTVTQSEWTSFRHDLKEIKWKGLSPE